MIDITVQEILDKTGRTLSTTAADLGISISLLSKIKNSVSPITDETQEKFQKLYPHLRLVNGTILWKEKYLEMVDKYAEAKVELDMANLENQKLRETLMEIARIAGR